MTPSSVTVTFSYKSLQSHHEKDAVGAYIWVSMYWACVKFFNVYKECVSSAVALHILGVG